jgi:hypothetical protein
LDDALIEQVSDMLSVIQFSTRSTYPSHLLPVSFESERTVTYFKRELTNSMNNVERMSLFFSAIMERIERSDRIMFLVGVSD